MNMYEMLKDATMLGRVVKGEQLKPVIPRKDQVMNYVYGYVDSLLKRQ